MSQSDMSQSESPESFDRDPKFEADVQRMHELTVLGRWLVAIGTWLTIGILSLWSLREPIALLQEYFTWAAVRHGLINHPIAAFGLALSVGLTVSVLVWQSRNIMFGLPPQERSKLEQQVLKINQQGPSHPLWKWLHRST